MDGKNHRTLVAARKRPNLCRPMDRALFLQKARLYKKIPSIIENTLII
jgi:hypothetical protein